MNGDAQETQIAELIVMVRYLKETLDETRSDVKELNKTYTENHIKEMVSLQAALATHETRLNKLERIVLMVMSAIGLALIGAFMKLILQKG